MRGRWLALLVGLLAVLAALFMMGRMAQQPGEPYSRPLVTLNMDQVGRIVIEGPKGRTVLEKGPDGWRLTAPVDYPAEPELMDATLGFLSGMTSNGVISTNPDKAALFQVDDAKGLHVSLYFADEADPRLRLTVGKLAPGFSHTYVKVDDQPEVHEVAGALRFQLERDATGWRDKRVLTFDPAAIDRVTLAGGRSVAVRRDGEGWAWDVGPEGGEMPAGAPATEAVERLVRHLSALRAQDFVDEPPAAPEKPLMSITLGRGADRSPIDLVIEAEVGPRYRVVAEADPQRYLLPKGLLAPYVTDPVATLRGDSEAAAPTAPEAPPRDATPDAAEGTPAP